MTTRLNSYVVTVRFYDAGSNQLAESVLQCSARTPGEACPPAYIPAREDAKQILERTAGVMFFVRPQGAAKQEPAP